MLIEFLARGARQVRDEEGQVGGGLEFDFAVGGFGRAGTGLGEVGFEDVHFWGARGDGDVGEIGCEWGT